MQLDIYTVLVASCAAVFLLGLQFLYFWYRDRGATWLAWWVTPFFCGALGISLRIQRGTVHDLISIGLSNALMFIAFGLAWQGARVFSRRKPLLMAVMLAPAAWMLLCLYPPFMNNLPLRIILASGGMSMLAALSAFELWRGREEQLPSRMPTVVLFSTFAGLLLLRIPLVEMMSFPVGSRPMDGTTTAVFNLVICFHLMSITMLMVSMTKERRESQQRAFAQSDPLTGLANRRAFVTDAERLVQRHLRNRQPLSVLVLDIDHFKSINDRFGHEAGDRVLVGFAAAVKDCLRPTDLFYRMGGEEFCCLLPDVKGRDARTIAERICMEVQASHFDTIGGRVRITVSIGAASSELSGCDLDVLMGEADTAVYEAKATGRNRVVLGGEVIYRPTVGITRHYAA